MSSFNQAIFMGNLTRDPEVKYLGSGTAVAEFGIAVNDRVKKGDEWIDEVMFIDAVIFGRTAEVAGEYLSKGSPVFLTGRLRLETWEKEGQKRSKHKLVVDKMQMIGGRGGGGGGGGGEHDQTRRDSRQDYNQDPPQAPATNSKHQDPPPAGYTQDEIPF